MIRLDPDNLAVLLVGSIDSEIASSPTGLIHEPEVAEGGGEGRRDASDGICAEVGQEVIEDGEEEESPGREESGNEHFELVGKGDSWQGEVEDGLELQLAMAKRL